MIRFEQTKGTKAIPPTAGPAPLLDSLKQILENLRTPERLGGHPWVDSLSVHEARRLDTSLTKRSPGAQLVMALGDLFRQLIPATPPQHDGKRLDTRWGRFGLLAANYFAPLLFGTAYPRSLRDAWRRIDQAILLFAFGTTADHLTPAQIESFRFIGDEVDMPATSTISDWHRSGLQDLLDLFVNREQNLSLSLGQPSVVLANDDDSSRGANSQNLSGSRGTLRRTTKTSSSLWRWGLYVLLTLVLATALFAGVTAYRLNRQLQTVKADMALFNGYSLSAFQPQDLQKLGPVLDKTKTDLATLQSGVAPWLWLTGRLGWFPVYGGDLRSAGDLLDTASNLIASADLTYHTALPIWTSIHGSQTLKASDVTSMLINSRPSLLLAQADLAKASASRLLMDTSRLSPGPRALLARVDPYLTSLDQVLTFALAVPRLLGATDSGPKTYLIMIENEDELRATGGFVTAVGKAVVWNGQLINLSITDSYSVDDINKAYPAAPWQLQSFMNLPIMTFRDTSWFTDFPTAVRWAEYLYAYTNNNSVNGVIAIDQHVLASLLTVTSPIFVPEINTTVTADNLRIVMRAQKVPPPADQQDPNWHRKQFMNPISAAILQRLTSGNGISWEQLLHTMMSDLDERHILVQLDDPTLAILLAERGWDGAVRNPGGDFLMAVDTNVGYNKTNAVVTTNLTYDVDLTKLSTPTSTLTVFHQNNAQGQTGPCDQRPPNLNQSQLEYWYAIDRCYYNYLRIYVPAGTQLTSATPHAVTRDEMVMLDQDVPVRVDILDESIPSVQGFGTLLMVPMQGSLQTSFHFNLPDTVIQRSDAGGEVYNLKVEKQAGTDVVPVTLRVHLPPGSQINSVNLANVQDGSNILFNLNMKTDLYVRIEFRP